MSDTENDTTHDATTDPGADALPLSTVLKLAGVVGTGGQAKVLIQAGDVRVNGEVETRRKRLVHPGDEIQVGDDVFTLDVSEVEPEDEA
jgi:ribosome-associated protein